jgi:DNA-binding LacI/PurR family transcriptional regulator
VAQLISDGRTRVAAIGAEARRPASSTIRLAAYKEALDDAGLAFDPDLVGYVSAFRRPDGAATMSILLDLPDPPDAVFCFADPLALGALRVLHERGIQIPEHVAVIGFDDIEDGHFSTPSLSSLSPDKKFIAG